MSKRSKSFQYRMLFLSAGTVALTVPAMGGVTLQDLDTNTTNLSSLPAAWPSSSLFGAPFLTDANANGECQPNNGGMAGVNETVNPGNVECQTFTVNTSFSLGAISLVTTGGTDDTTNPMSIHLFQLNPRITGSSTGYVLATDEVGPDLLGGGSGLNFSYPGDPAYGITEFDFNGTGTTDNVVLTAGTVYALELWSASTNDQQLFVVRNSGGDAIPQPYTGGANLADDNDESTAQESFSPNTRGDVVGPPSLRDLGFAIYSAGAATGSTSGNWIGTGGGSWTNTNNWTNSTAPNGIGAPAVFASSITASSTVTLDAAWTVGSITFNNPTNSYTLAPGSGGVLALNNGTNTATVVNTGGGNHIISAPIFLQSIGQFTNSTSAGTLTISGNISGNNAFEASGSGLIVLSGNNSWGGGGSQLQQGTVQLGSNGALPAASPLVLATGATLDLNGFSPTVSTLFGNGTIDDVAGGGTCIFTNGSSATSTFSGVIRNTTGSVEVNFVGTGTLVLAPGPSSGTTSNTFTGGIVVGVNGTVVGATSGAIPPAEPITNNGTFSVQSGTTTTLGKLTGSGALVVGGTTEVQLVSGSGAATQGTVNIATGGTIDITNNKLVLNYGSASADPETAIVADLASGYNAGAWTGTGIISSTAAANSPKFTVGYLDGNKDAAALTKGSVAANQAIVKYTLAGDAYLENSVGFDDLIIVAQHYGQSGWDWAGGDFNYDPSGSVGFADLIDVAKNYGLSSGVSQDSGSGGGVLSLAFQSNVSAVPEPSALALAGVGGAMLTRRRKNRK